MHSRQKAIHWKQNIHTANKIKCSKQNKMHTANKLKCTLNKMDTANKRKTRARADYRELARRPVTKLEIMQTIWRRVQLQAVLVTTLTMKQLETTIYHMGPKEI